MPTNMPPTQARPARYVDIDADLAVSTLQALRWLSAHGLLVAGTLLGYATRSMPHTGALRELPPHCRYRSEAWKGPYMCVLHVVMHSPLSVLLVSPRCSVLQL